RVQADRHDPPRAEHGERPPRGHDDQRPRPPRSLRAPPRGTDGRGHDGARPCGSCLAPRGSDAVAVPRLVSSRGGNDVNELRKRQLGRTGLQVTMLGYGAMEIRGAPRGRDVSDQQAETILHAVLDSGINYIDTSIDYGVSEERIGRYIGDRRAEYYLASK